jgi:hypothetical protein
VGTGYELGVAVGRLRRLKDLALDMFEDGRIYHAMAQGLAASGGDCPLPLLWRVQVLSEVCGNADLLASLLLPSVRVFCSFHDDFRAALVMACALRQAGYKYAWVPWCDVGCVGRKSKGPRDELGGLLQSIIAPGRCRVDEGPLTITPCPWTIRGVWWARWWG